MSPSALEQGAVLVAEFVFALAIGPLLLAVIQRMKARSQHRVGPSLLQPYRELSKLLGRQAVFSTDSSWLTRYGPWISFGALVATVPLVPWFIVPAPLGLVGDLIVIVGLFGLSRFLTALAALDAGSTFGGMGSTREMWMGALAEPALLLVIFALGSPAGSTNAGVIAGQGASLGLAYVTPPLLLAVVAYLLVLLTETGRLPVDNPDTHLELTMVHEATVLEYSGRDLALIEWGQGLKFAVMVGLLVALAAPWGIALAWSLPWLLFAAVLLVLKVLGTTLVVGGIETRVAKWRLFRVADLTTLAAVLAFGAIALTYLVGGGA